MKVILSAKFVNKLQILQDRWVSWNSWVHCHMDLSMVGKAMDSKVWHLKSKSDYRFRMGHPWAMANELQESPKGIEPGSAIELRDSRNEFLAYGYGNPKSNIAFRELSRKPAPSHPLFDHNFVIHRLRQCLALRKMLGWNQFSFRLIHGEGDHLPGLIIDRFLLADGIGQVFVLQAHTAGAQALLPQMVDGLKTLSQEMGFSWEQVGIVIRNDLAVRKFEGLQPEEPRILKALAGWTPEFSEIAVAKTNGEKIIFSCDLLRGQKTGFFLDQAHNISLAKAYCLSLFRGRDVRLLDLFSYVGQWSTQLGVSLAKADAKVSLFAQDASEGALQMTKSNWDRNGLAGETLKSDILQDLKNSKSESYDIVVCDPPALIKSRKDHGPGKQAYVKLNREAMRLLKPGGLFISCSCSGLLTEEDLQEALLGGARKSQSRFQWIARGSQSPDHPVRMEFPEGRYLKMWIGIKESTQ